MTEAPFLFYRTGIKLGINWNKLSKLTILSCEHFFNNAKG